MRPNVSERADFAFLSGPIGLAQVRPCHPGNRASDYPGRELQSPLLPEACGYPGDSSNFPGVSRIIAKRDFRERKTTTRIVPDSRSRGFRDDKADTRMSMSYDTARFRNAGGR